MKSPPSPARPLLSRLDRQTRVATILETAERLFAQKGYDGVSLDDIARAFAVRRQNILYYFASKESIYLAVLDKVMDSWLDSMAQLSTAQEPQEAIRNYVQAKLRFSQDHPHGSAVFTREVLGGMPLFTPNFKKNVIPLFQKDIGRLREWAMQGKIRSIDFEHLIFLLWAMTQAYADLAPQFALLLGKTRLGEADFAAAQEIITSLVWSTLRLKP